MCTDISFLFQIKRTFRREGDSLQQIVEMETDQTAMTEHLRITYKKVDS
jgi:uncharacterized membrane protein affecting hemolysin expression